MAWTLQPGGPEGICVTRNVAASERAVSIAAGAGLLYLASRVPARRGLAQATGLGLLARGATGYCPVNYAVGRQPRAQDTRQALAGPRGINVRESITIERPVDEVYRFWRDLTALPAFMPHLERVDPLGGSRTHWVARGPAGMRVEWDAELINDIENELIAWKSIEGADVVSAGSVSFRPAPRGGTELRATLQYAPPAGKAGAWVATLLGSNPSAQIREDLRHVKQQLETGERATVEGQPRGDRGWRLFPFRRRSRG